MKMGADRRSRGQNRLVGAHRATESPLRPWRESPVGVTWPATWRVPGAEAPVGGRWPLHLQLLHHVVADAGRDALEQLPLEQPELGGPRRRVGLHGQFTVTERNRLRVFGHVLADQFRPPAEHLTARQALGPTAVGGDPGGQSTQGLRVPVVRSGARPTTSATTAGGSRRTLADTPRTTLLGRGAGGGKSGPCEVRPRQSTLFSDFRCGYVPHCGRVIHTIHRVVPRCGSGHTRLAQLVRHDAPPRHGRRNAARPAPRARPRRPPP